MRIDTAAKPLRILIASTPKTGNTWLMSLLSAVYDLPKVAVLYPFDRSQVAQLGERWITFHHMLPEPDLLDWIEETRPFLITTIRHPGDVLISLYHHIHRFPSEPVDPIDLRRMLAEPFARVDIEPPARHTFSDELECSLAWIRLRKSRVVRYEDLRCATLRTLTDLTSWIGPASKKLLEQAISRCDLQLMRSLAGPHKGFFRSGSVGEWRTLPPDVLDVFEAEPYKQQFSELGYTLTREDETPAARLSDYLDCDPFGAVACFANGVAVVPILKDFYLSLDPEKNSRWPPIASTGPGSFLDWCNSSSSLLGIGWYAGVPLSNLAHYIYRSRPDLQNAFPDLSGANRVDYAEWFIRKHNAAYGLDAYFADPIRRAFLQWGNARHPQDRLRRRPWWPKLTNFAMHVYENSQELQAWFEDCQFQDRWKFLEWMVGADHRLPIFPELAQSINEDLNRRRGIRLLGGALQRRVRRLTNLSSR